jgi:gentisate 1,2-dioxygenase
VPAATPTIAAAYQMLFPGESAPVHAHSMSALRFGLAGHGARMIIDGDRVPMEPGDLILSPGVEPGPHCDAQLPLYGPVVWSWRTGSAACVHFADGRELAARRW